MSHPSEDLLIQFAAGGVEEIGDHVEACESCSREVESVRAIIGDVYPEDGGGDEIELESRRMERERQVATKLIDTLPSVSDAELRNHLLENAELGTAGGVMELLEWVQTVRWNRPSRAAIGAEALVESTQRFQQDQSSLYRGLRVAALRELGSTKRSLGLYEEALDIFTQAETVAESLPIKEFELSRIWYERARTYLEMGECDIARQWAESAAEGFLRFGDQRRVNRARYLIAGCLYNQGATSASVAAFESLLTVLANDGDVVSMAHAQNSLGQLYVRLNRVSEALAMFDKAIAMYRERGMSVDQLRAEWGIARAWIAGSEYERATGELKRVVERFEGLGLLEEAGLAKLDLYEALVLLGRSEEAAVVIRESVTTLSGRFSRREQQRAITYLQEIAQLDDPRPEQVREVADYLDVSRFNPHLSFSPDSFIF